MRQFTESKLGQEKKYSDKSVIIIGGGYTGLAAAYELANAGIKTTIFEAEKEVGGLAGTFEILPKILIEKFYHHWFTSDHDILNFLSELGLGDEICFNQSNTGLYYANSIYRLSKPLDLLRLKPLSALDRIRTGYMVLKARKIAQWQTLENISAAEWIIKNAGIRSYETIWKPLLLGKFGSEADNISAVWFWNKLKLRGSSRGNSGNEQLAYFKGSFGAATTAIKRRLEQLRVEIKTGSPVTRIVSTNGEAKGVESEGQFFSADGILVTVPLPIFLQLTPDLPEKYHKSLSKIRFLGNVCIVLRLKQTLSSTYWLNVADPSFPFVGVIEHTNFDHYKNYNGERIAYLSKYLPTNDPLFSLSDTELLDFCLPYISKIFPKFSKEWLLGFNVWRASYSQPVITKNYSNLIPPAQTPIQNLWLSTMAQIYPEDRGTNYAVRYGRNTARKIIECLTCKGTGGYLHTEPEKRKNESLG